MVAFEEAHKFDAVCLKHRVQRLQMYGSVARGQADAESDVDFVVQFEAMPAEEYSAHFFGLLHDLEDQLQRPVDLLTWDSVKRSCLKKAIQADAILIYEG